MPSETASSRRRSRLWPGAGPLNSDLPIGVLTVATILCVILAEWLGLTFFGLVSALVTLPLALLLFLRVGLSRRVYVLVAVILAAVTVYSHDDWPTMLLAALRSGAYFVGFFAALMLLRYMTEGSKALRRCAEYLADQPPGRRYGALTLGACAFTLVLNIGSIVFLGQLVVQNRRADEDPRRRAIRERRMLLAIQRGFIASLPWSPLALAMALGVTLVPGGTWLGALAPTLVTGAVMAGLGWALDWIFKPRPVGAPAPRSARQEGWTVLLPLLALLLFLMLAIGGMQYVSGLRTISVIMLVVPVIALALIAWQYRHSGSLRQLGEVARRYAGQDLARQSSELTLLMTAAFIGTLGAALLSPVLHQIEFDFFGLSGRAILILVLWTIPIAGLLGMNPIMTVSLIVPLLPTPAAMGVDPSDVIVAITGGWALTSGTSPLTATTLFIASFARVDPIRVGLVWNGPYALIAGIILSAWVAWLAG